MNSQDLWIRCPRNTGSPRVVGDSYGSMKISIPNLQLKIWNTEIGRDMLLVSCGYALKQRYPAPPRRLAPIVL